MNGAVESFLKLELRIGCPFVYRLVIYGDEVRSIKEKWIGQNRCNFTNPVSLNKTPKLYVIRKIDGKKEILYVGYADQGIGDRMRYGLNPKHQKTYHGYGWMHEGEVELLVWVFQSLKPDIPENEGFNKLLKRTVECVEAEVVYHIRETTGDWPKFQTEIHFGNVNREEVMRVREDISGWLDTNN